MLYTQMLPLRYLFLCFTLLNLTGNAQTPWSGAYGNEWLSEKYGQQWIKIGVVQKGIHKVHLPAFFQNKPNQLHLYHRGVEVALTNVTNTEIEFYGVPNDGASDALLYRPYTGTRQNEYYSFYSDESAYFLTISSGQTKEAIRQASLVSNGSPEEYHLQKEVKIYTESDTYIGSDNLALHALDQSYLVEGKGRSSKAYFKRLGATPFGDPIFQFPFQLKNLITGSGPEPVIEVLFNGRTFSKNVIKASIGKVASALTDYPDLTEFSDFITYKKEFGIKVSKDVDAIGKGHFQLESTKLTDQSSTTGIFSVNYIRLIYPQGFNMAGVNTTTFNLLPTEKLASNISVLNVPVNAKVYDITDVHNPRIVGSNFVGTTLNLMITRKANQELNLLVSSEVKTVEDDKISAISFVNYNYADSDYLIITNETLWEAASEYANYRKSMEGGNYKPTIVKIKDIYNQFNYGEPSPVAIRHFVDYMIKNSPKEKHNLLLIGPSTTQSSKLILNRELKEDVPTVSFPGSDLLLVEGLVAGETDVPAIPVGRINATSPEQVRNYLSKVMYYEQNQEEGGWKKKVLHLNGGKSASEISQFKSFLSELVPIVETGEVGGKVKAVVKQSTVEVEKANISSEVNEGVGMISYMGHGNPAVTDLDMGYISDAANSYNNIGKYPLMYFNGCGVGDIFYGRNNPSPASADRLPQSSDWINSKDKGAIAIIANSYYSFQTSSSRYLQELYNLIFGSKEASILTIGQIQKNVAKKIVGEVHSDYDIANIHQSLLQGDPALRLIKVDQQDYSVNKSEAIMILSESDDKLIEESKTVRVGVRIANNGKYNKSESLPIQLNYSFTDGTSGILNPVLSSIAFEDTVYITLENRKPLSKISVVIDPKNVLKERSKDNNFSELTIDWNVAKNLKVYPAERLKDVIPPIMNVSFNDSKIKNGDTILEDPKISITLTDDRQLNADTTLIDIFLKPCSDESCDFRRLSFKGNDVKFTTTENGTLKLDYASKIIAGHYELLVSAKDLSGNVTIQSYKIQFNVVDGDFPNIVVSPNPASEYIHFELSKMTKEMNSIRSIIYDASGKLIHSRDIDSKLKDWYWIPAGQPSGLYLYKVIMIDSTGKRNVFTGKVVLVK